MVRFQPGMKRRAVRGALMAVAIAALAVLIPLEASWGGTGPTLSIVPAAAVGKLMTDLDDVDATSPSLAWAAGFWRPNPDLDRPLFERWNGKAWVAIKGKTVSAFDNALSGVAVTSSKSVWGVGYAQMSDSASKTLIERWTPKGVKVVKSVSPGPWNVLSDVVVLGNASAFAVGSWTKGDLSHALIERWNGKKWTLVDAHAPSSGSVLTGVDARSTKDAWAVGYSVQNGALRTLIEHWDGKAWNVVPSPNRGTASTTNRLTGVTVLSGKDAWAVGWIEGAGNTRSNLTLHWNGKAWSIVPVPQPGSFQSALYSVAAVGPKDVLAVGNYANPGGGNYNTMALEWNGAAWTVVPTPNPGSGYHNLSGIAALGSGGVWAVGYYEKTSTQYVPLALRRSR